MAEGSGASPSSLPNSSSGEGSSQSQVSSADLQSLPIMYPSFLPGFLPPQNEEHDRGAGLYAVAVPPLGSVPGLYSNTLIPLTYNIPTVLKAGSFRSSGSGARTRSKTSATAAKTKGNVGAVNENPHPENGIQPAEHRHPEEPGPMEENRVQWWGLAKEIQMLVIGFITSLLPGFQHHHHHDD
ncbi:hypothetical protein QJS04_geneDACA004100 [Acorus gramineus]|uniref:Uncharacterized protein n=1 Tax=Acorus gramineus TaxID=55184 RepID=A0AAV9BJ58_ACOGR|nr:hypothetical protein QJS04_geneDACA004100 [Acorus gramineus]